METGGEYDELSGWKKSLPFTAIVKNTVHNMKTNDTRTYIIVLFKLFRAFPLFFRLNFLFRSENLPRIN